MSYIEHLVSSPLVACTWEQVTTLAQEQRVVPDACVDLIWSEERLIIAGPDTTARLVSLHPGSRLVGARLRPGAAGAVLDLPVSELADLSREASEVLGHDLATELLERLDTGADPHALLRSALEPHTLPDPLVRAAIARLGKPQVRVGATAAELGVRGASSSAGSAMRSDTGRRCLPAYCASGGCKPWRPPPWSSWRSTPAMPIRPT